MQIGGLFRLHDFYRYFDNTNTSLSTLLYAGPQPTSVEMTLPDFRISSCSPDWVREKTEGDGDGLALVLDWCWEGSRPLFGDESRLCGGEERWRCWWNDFIGTEGEVRQERGVRSIWSSEKRAERKEMRKGTSSITGKINNLEADKVWCIFEVEKNYSVPNMIKSISVLTWWLWTNALMNYTNLNTYDSAGVNYSRG